MLERSMMLGLALAVAGCAGTKAPVPVEGAPGVTIPAAVKDALNERWNDWQIVAPPAVVAACASRFDSPPSAVATGDWNGDGSQDVAFQISSPEGRRIVAALQRIDGYTLTEVSPVKEADGVLGVKRQGKSYRHEDKGIEHFYSLNTLAFGPCNQPETAYFWNGSGFEGRPVF